MIPAPCCCGGLDTCESSLFVGGRAPRCYKITTSDFFAPYLTEGRAAGFNRTQYLSGCNPWVTRVTNINRTRLPSPWGTDGCSDLEKTWEIALRFFERDGDVIARVTIDFERVRPGQPSETAPMHWEQNLGPGPIAFDRVFDDFTLISTPPQYLTVVMGQVRVAPVVGQSTPLVDGEGLRCRSYTAGSAACRCGLAPIGWRVRWKEAGLFDYTWDTLRDPSPWVIDAWDGVRYFGNLNLNGALIERYCPVTYENGHTEWVYFSGYEFNFSLTWWNAQDVRQTQYWGWRSDCSGACEGQLIWPDALHCLYFYQLELPHCFPPIPGQQTLGRVYLTSLTSQDD